MRNYIKPNSYGVCMRKCYAFCKILENFISALKQKMQFPNSKPILFGLRPFRLLVFWRHDTARKYGWCPKYGLKMRNSLQNQLLALKSFQNLFSDINTKQLEKVKLSRKSA